MFDFIQGQKFIEIADMTFAPPQRAGDDYDGLPNTFHPSKLKDINLVYTHTMYAKQLFDVLNGYPYIEFVVITHNSDVNVDFIPPDNVRHWFTQNVNIVHPRIESIPIGLENDRWFVNIRKKEKMERRMGRPQEYGRLLYINHNVATNPAKRTLPYQILANLPFVTAKYGFNGEEFDSYLNDICTHRFVLCPEGNGIDTHRIWETLYMGNIPIVENNINNTFYRGFPMLVVDNWHQITEDFLSASYGIISAIPRPEKKLTFKYWKNKILTKCGR